MADVTNPSTTWPDGSSWVPPPPSPTAPVAGARSAATWPPLAGYTVLSELGRGATGVVLLARDDDLHRLVAIKLMRGGVFASTEEVDRFRHEALVGARLRHPNIVQVLSFEKQADQGILVQEYVPGCSLQVYLQRQVFSPFEAAGFIKEVAEAVGHAHEHGVVHRDLKPGNILIEYDVSLPTPPRPGEIQAKIADFGLAKLLAGEADATATKSPLRA